MARPVDFIALVFLVTVCSLFVRLSKRQVSSVQTVAEFILKMDRTVLRLREVSTPPFGGGVEPSPLLLRPQPRMARVEQSVECLAGETKVQ
jgi:hypothetical protein